MESLHRRLEHNHPWYQQWHQDRFSSFIHWFILIIFAFVVVFNLAAYLGQDKGRILAASPWVTSTKAQWDQGSFSNISSSGVDGGKIMLGESSNSFSWGSGGDVPFSGNSSLNGTRLDSSEILLDWNRSTDGSDTIGLWPADDRHGNSSNKNIGSRYGDIPAVTLGQSGSIYGTGYIDSHSFNDTFTSASSNLLDSKSAYVVQAWVNVKNVPAGSVVTILTSYAWGNDIKFGLWITSSFRRIIFYWWPDGPYGTGSIYYDHADISGDLAVGSPDWHHIAVEWTGTKLNFYFDGIRKGQLDRSNWPANASRLFKVEPLGALVDDLKCQDASQWDGNNFTPHRFEQGTAVLTHSFSQAQTLHSVSWSATESGDNEGDIKKVEVYNTDTSSWQQIGGDSPVSPISGLNIPIADGSSNILRFTLDPKSDSLQTETPKITSVSIDTTSLSPSGTYTSKVQDLGFKANPNSIQTDEILNGGSISYYFRAGNKSAVDASWTNWLSIADQNKLPSALAGHRFFQFKTTFAIGSSSPELRSLILNYSSVPPSILIKSPLPDQYFGPSEVVLVGQAQTNQGASLAKVQVKVADGGWQDASGTDNWSFGFTPTASGQIEILARAQNSDGIYSDSYSLLLRSDVTPPKPIANLRLINGTNPILKRPLVYLDFKPAQDQETSIAGYQIFCDGELLPPNQEEQAPSQRVIRKTDYLDEQNLILSLPGGESVELTNLASQTFFIDNRLTSGGSHNYQVKAVDELGNLSGAVTATLNLASQEEELLVKNLKAEPSTKLETDQSGQTKTSALISYQTNNLATSEVSYGIDTLDQFSQKENALNQEHVIVLDDLRPGQTYQFIVKGIDQYGESFESERHSFLTQPEQAEKGIVEIIFDVLREAFSWIKRVMAGNGGSVAGVAEQPSLVNSIKVVDISNPARSPGQGLAEYAALVVFKKDQSLKRSDGETLVQSPSKGYLLDKNLKIGETISYQYANQANSGLAYLSSLTVGRERLEGKPVLSNIGYREITVAEDSIDLLISFDSDRPAYSSLEINNQKYQIDRFNTKHNYLIKDLAPQTTYNFKIRGWGRDKGAITIVSDQSLTTSAALQLKGLLQIIIDALKQAFAWVREFAS